MYDYVWMCGGITRTRKEPVKGGGGEEEGEEEWNEVAKDVAK